MKNRRIIDLHFLKLNTTVFITDFIVVTPAKLNLVRWCYNTIFEKNISILKNGIAFLDLLFLDTSIFYVE